MKLLSAKDAFAYSVGNKEAVRDVALDNLIDDIATNVFNAVLAGQTSLNLQLDPVPSEVAELNEQVMTDLCDHMREQGYKVTRVGSTINFDWSNSGN